MSAQPMHTGPGPSMIKSPPAPPQTVHANSLIGEMTTSSGGRLWRSASRARLRSDSSVETQCVRYARSVAGSPPAENRSGCVARERATCAVSLGSSPRAVAQPPNRRSALETFPGPACTTCSR